MRVRDHATDRQAYSGPGADTRQWCSFGTVDLDTSDARSVTFTKEFGPLVNVTLRPSAIPVVCRVAHEVAGNGEGEWFPFVGGDEVMVLIPEGDEQAGCVIVGRLNQEIDQWPQQVAGMDATKNNFAFRRLRTPYVLETASNYLVRDATTGAFFGIKDGALTFSNADKAYLHLGADFLGFQTSDATTLLQLDVANKRITLQASGTQLSVDGSASNFLSSGTLSIGTSGNQPGGHAISLEQLLAVLTGIAESIATTGATPLTGTSFGALVVAALTAPAGPTSALELASVFPITPYVPAITAALQVPPQPSASIPGVACAGLTVG